MSLTYNFQTRLGNTVHMIKTFFIRLIHAVIKHNIGSLAAIIAFFGFSSLMPVCALLIFIASLFVPNTTVARFIEGVLQSYIPPIPTGATFAATTIHHLTMYRADIRVIGIIGLLWGAIGGFVTLQQVLDTIYEVKTRRSFWIQYIVGFVMMGILLVLTVASSLITWISPIFLVTITHLTNASATHVLHHLGQIVFPIVLFITCYCCYRILPSRSLRNVPLVVGALIATVFIYLSRFGYVIYTHHLGSYSILYGAFTFVMLLTFWIYIVCIILLIGAEAAVTVHELMRESGNQKTRKLHRSPA
ncbi:YihY/virulence factor BrkB family protein [Alicyclobacillus hesperidum]|uniref:YihY/virulence factor BrkB family protein n=2 Tax=Alicyclobacillus hesperidum TaxID=89784 RepID=UPI0009D972CC|nr:YihY/virulence factor BrkB family protein [Alicyclobacillus hesperidum]